MLSSRPSPKLAIGSRTYSTSRNELLQAVHPQLTTRDPATSRRVVGIEDAIASGDQLTDSSSPTVAPPSSRSGKSLAIDASEK
jgi:hypothetical protein